MKELVQLHCDPLAGNMRRLAGRDISQLNARLPAWETHIKKGQLRLEKLFQFRDFRQALTFTNRIAQLANEEDHHPAILTEWVESDRHMVEHKSKGLHKNDFIMAAKTEQAYGMSS